MGKKKGRKTKFVLLDSKIAAASTSANSDNDQADVSSNVSETHVESVRNNATTSVEKDKVSSSTIVTSGLPIISNTPAGRDLDNLTQLYSDDTKYPNSSTRRTRQERKKNNNESTAVATSGIDNISKTNPSKNTQHETNEHANRKYNTNNNHKSNRKNDYQPQEECRGNVKKDLREYVGKDSSHIQVNINVNVTNRLSKKNDAGQRTEACHNSVANADNTDQRKKNKKIKENKGNASNDTFKSEQNSQNNPPSENRYRKKQELAQYPPDENTAEKYWQNDFDHLNSENWDDDCNTQSVQEPSASFDMKNQDKINQSGTTYNTRKSLPTPSHNKPISKRHSEGINSENFSQNSSRGSSKSWRDKDPYDRSSEITDAEYKKFLEEERKMLKVEYTRVNEIQKDLFEMSKEYSLGHCVAEDMRMGSGIAVSFKREFRDTDFLLNQRQKPGGLAVLEDNTDAGTRYIYYMVTKRESTGKPTYEKFWSSLQKMRDHISEHDVKKLAIPRLGCGLDRLEWSRVKHMIEFLFRDLEVEITVCNFQQTEDSFEKKIIFTCKVVNVQKAIADIEEETIIIYLSTEDGHVSREMDELDKKFHFLGDFKRSRRQLGDAIKFQVPNKYYLLYGCIVRKTMNDNFDFVSFRKSLNIINNNNKKDPYNFIGIQAIKDCKDTLLMEKILTIMKNYLKKIDIYVCWDGDLAHAMPLSYRD